MTVAEAKNATVSWVSEHRREIEGYAGAYFAGSTNSLHDNDVLAPWSDVDFHILVDGDIPAGFRHRKFRYHGVLMEQLYMRLEDMRSLEQVVASHWWACHFLAENIISDPTGHLATIQSGVRKNYHKKKWVLARCQGVLRWLDGFLRSFDESLGDDISSLFLFLGCIVIASTLPVVADLRPPTARKGLVRMREVASQYGRADLYETLLEIAGVSRVVAEGAVEIHQRLMEAFDYAVHVHRTRFYYDFDLYEEAREILRDGVVEMIHSGDYREAAWFSLLIHNRCLLAIVNDGAIANRKRFQEKYSQTTSALGLSDSGQLTQRVNRLREFMPALNDFCVGTIVAKNPTILP